VLLRYSATAGAVWCAGDTPGQARDARRRRRGGRRSCNEQDGLELGVVTLHPALSLQPPGVQSSVAASIQPHLAMKMLPSMLAPWPTTMEVQACASCAALPRSVISINGSMVARRPSSRGSRAAAARQSVGGYQYWRRRGAGCWSRSAEPQEDARSSAASASLTADSLHSGTQTRWGGG